MWAAIAKFFRQIIDGLAFCTPFIGPAFLGAILNAIWRKHLRRGVTYLLSAIFSSTVAGAVLTPLFAHVGNFPESASGSTAAFVAIIGYEAINRICGDSASKDSWDDAERRKAERAGDGD